MADASKCQKSKNNEKLEKKLEKNSSMNGIFPSEIVYGYGFQWEY